ncbi:MAG: hypothetical protein LBH98_04740 [Chitinispirillales bacterium]|jgi:cell division protein FtsI/penicillin-binding protein 2|nr:hypothetical protein [Chitinispirillales bacterium]
MRKNDDEKINIPLSKFLMIGFLCFFAFHFFEKGKENKMSSQKDSTVVSVKEKPVKKISSDVKIPKMNFDDICKTLQQNHPDFTQNCDTVKWQKSQIIRYFSIDTALQKKTLSLVKRSNPKYGAAIAVNPKTGQILAMVSYNDPELPKIADNLCLSNKFPAASIFKTITAEAVFETTNITCSTQIYYVGENTTLYKRQFLPEKFPENSNSASFAEAYAKSINPVFGWLAIHEIGRDNLYKSVQKFGYNTKIPFEMPTDISYFPETTISNTNDSINLAELGCGFNSETTLTPLLGGLIAATISNGGVMMTPMIIDSVTDMSGKKLYSAAQKKWRISAAPDISDSIKYIMRQTTKIGSARNAFSAIKDFSKQKDIIFGGKTGTKDSDLGRNEWFVGFAQDVENDFSIATSICFVQKPMFILRPSQVSADMMLEYIRKTRKQINETKRQENG